MPSCALGAFGTTTRAICLQIMSENIWLPESEMREDKGTGEIVCFSCFARLSTPSAVTIRVEHNL